MAIRNAIVETRLAATTAMTAFQANAPETFDAFSFMDFGKT